MGLIGVASDDQNIHFDEIQRDDSLDDDGDTFPHEPMEL